MALDRLTNITRSGLGSVHSYDVGGVVSTGVITATAFVGDISQATGAAAGLGTALSEDQSSPLNKIYYTNQILSVDSTVTVNPPDSSNIAYTQYAEIAVEDGYDLIVEDGDDLIPDILGLSTVTATPLSGAGGRIRADQFTNKAGTGAPTFTSGLNVSDGNVGIGTDNPTESKVVIGHTQTSTVKHLAIKDLTNNWVRKLGVDSSNNFGIFSGDTEQLRITGIGSVGIGENDPEVLLHLKETNANPYNTVITHLKLDNGGGNQGSGSRIELKTGPARCWIQSYINGPNANSGGDIVFGTPSSAALGVERLRITGGGDVLIGGQTAYTYDDTGDSNTILDIWNSGNDKRGILSLSGQTNGGAAIGTIWFNNDNNAGTGPAANMKLSAAIQADAVTSDSNAGSDAGGFLKFYTKPEAGALIESMRITSDGDIYQRDQRVHTVLHTEYRHLTGSVNSDSVGSWVDIKNFGYTPKRSGSLIVCHFQVQTWNGSTTTMNGDIYFRARFDQGTGNYVSVTYGGNNNRMTGNFDQDNNRQHLYYTHTFGFTAQNTNQHTINLQASNGSALSTDFNWFHTVDNANGCWIFEYDQ